MEIFINLSTHCLKDLKENFLVQKKSTQKVQRSKSIYQTTMNKHDRALRGLSKLYIKERSTFNVLTYVNVFFQVLDDIQR